MINTQKEAHIELNGTVKTVQITDNFTEFKKSCEKAHDLASNTLDNYFITYIDDEEDKVIISNEFDYDQAMLFISNPKIPNLRINLESKNSSHDLTKINITESILLQEMNDHDSIKREDSEKYLDFDDLQPEIELQKKELEEERLRTISKKVEVEGIRESHYNMIDNFSQINSDHNIKENDIKISLDNKVKGKNWEEIQLTSDVNKKFVNFEKIIEELHDNPQEEIDIMPKQDEIEILEVKVEKETGLISEAEENKPNDYEISLQQQKEELLREKRKISVLEKIRKKAQEDLVKINLPFKEENSEVKDLNVNLIKFGDDSVNQQPEILIENQQNNPVENHIVKRADRKRCHLVRKISNDLDHNYSFSEDATESEAQLKERIVNSTVQLIERKLEKFKEIIVNKTIKRTDKLISKYIEHTKKINDHAIPKQSQVEKVPKRQISIHEDIRCDGCSIKPIKGDRYKCSVCENFDLCEKCEEENYQKGKQHPHNFIRIRQPIHSDEILPEINPKPLYNSIDIPLKIEPNNSKKIESDSSLIISNVKYSSQCISNLLELNYYLDSKENPKIVISLKNDGLVSWPKPCFLGSLKEKSSIDCRTIPVAANINPTGEINLEIKFNFPEDKQVKPGNYICFVQLYYSSSKIYFGEEICIFVNVLEPEYMSKYNEMNAREKKKFSSLVKEMRENYQIGEEVYPDSRILKALLKEDGDTEKALMALLEDLN